MRSPRRVRTSPIRWSDAGATYTLAATITAREGEGPFAVYVYRAIPSLVLIDGKLTPYPLGAVLPGVWEGDR